MYICIYSTCTYPYPGVLSLHVVHAQLYVVLHVLVVHVPVATTQKKGGKGLGPTTLTYTHNVIIRQAIRPNGGDRRKATGMGRNSVLISGIHHSPVNASEN